MKKVIFFFFATWPLLVHAQFGPIRSVTPRNNLFSPIFSGDFDGDGDTDLAGIDDAGTPGWFENVDGLGIFFTEPHIIAPGQKSALHFADIDGDGDLDAAFSSGSKTVWVQNLDGLGHFGPEKEATPAPFFSNFIHSYDLDGDEDLDLIQGYGVGIGAKLIWYKNEDGLGTFNSNGTVIIDSLGSSPQIAAADADGDGDLDLISQKNGEASWLENLDGLGNFAPPQVIQEIPSSNYENVNLLTMDIDSDSDDDLVVSYQSFPKLVWYENLDGPDTWGPPQVIDSISNKYNKILAAGDFDGDGDQDLVTYLLINSDGVHWYENTDGNGNFAPGVLVPATFNFILHFVTADFDGDSDLDFIFYKESPTGISWIENLDGLGTFGNETPLFYLKYNPDRAAAADFDGDGDTDVITLDDDRLFFYEDYDGEGHFLLPTIIDEFQYGTPKGLIAADFDNDGDYDITALINALNKDFGYYQNLDGQGHFSNFQNMMSGDFKDMVAVDMDLDLDLDHVVIGGLGYDLTWIENGTLQSFPIVGNEYYLHAVDAADLDGDGYPDVIAGWRESGLPDNKLVWFRNLNGTGPFGPENLIAHLDNLNEVLATDMDNDGDVDVLAGCTHNQNGKLISLFLNDGQGNFPQELVLYPTGNYVAISSMYVLDLDGDNDKDLLVSSNGADKTFWLENEGNLSFSEPKNFGLVSKYVFAADISGDGIPDPVYLPDPVVQDGGVQWRLNFFSSAQLKASCFLDENENGVLDPGEPGLRNQKITLFPDDIASWTNSEGKISYQLDLGAYTLNSFPDPIWYPVSSTQADIDITDLTTTISHDFAVKPAGVLHVAEPSISSAPTRCGFTVPFWLYVTNAGNQAVSGGRVSLELNDLVIFKNASPLPDSISGSTLFWKFEDLDPTYSKKIFLSLEMPDYNFSGQELSFHSTAYLYDGSTLVPSESYTYTPLVSCAWDPNDKLTSPDYPGDQNYTLFGETLEYTVRFQNTGNDTAFTVRIGDQLDPNLDRESFRFVAASHPVDISMDENGLLQFLFQNIMLPDSNTNEPRSHGFVKFRIDHLDDLPENTILSNSAGIFFDYNPPVLTNTVTNILVSQLPVGADDLTISPDPEFEVWPSPSDGTVRIWFSFQEKESWKIAIFDIRGNQVAFFESPENGSTSASLEIRDIPSGVYWMILNWEERTYQKKMVVIKPEK